MDVAIGLVVTVLFILLLVTLTGDQGPDRWIR